MTVPVWITPISMVVYTVLLMLLTEFMRRHYRTSMWVWVVSLVTIPLWIINIPGDDWFRWAKNLSVILPLIFAGLGRIAAVQQKDTPFWRLMRKRWVRWTLNSQMTQYSGSAAWYRIPMMKPPSLPRFPPLPGGSSDTWPSSHRRRTAP